MGGSGSMECCACLEPTSMALAPCGHPICGACAARWLDTRITCPTCRGVVALHPSAPLAPGICIDFHEDGEHVGVTFTSRLSAGVRVSRLDGNDRGRKCGLRVGHVITHINGLRIADPDGAARIVDRATEHKLPIHCALRTPPWRRVLSRFFRRRRPMA